MTNVRSLSSENNDKKRFGASNWCEGLGKGSFERTFTENTIHFCTCEIFDRTPSWLVAKMARGVDR